MTELQPEAVTIGVTVLGLMALGRLAEIAANVHRAVRRNPPVDVAIGQMASREDLKESRCEIAQACAARHAPIDVAIAQLYEIDRSRAAKNTEWQIGVAAQLGRIESAVTNLTRRGPSQHEPA